MYVVYMTDINICMLLEYIKWEGLTHPQPNDGYYVDYILYHTCIITSYLYATHPNF